MIRPEINIKPWEALSKDLKEGNTRSGWTDREPYAYWKGNPAVAATRMDLLKCNVSDKQEWNARVYAQVRTPQPLLLCLIQSHSVGEKFDNSIKFAGLAARTETGLQAIRLG